MVNILKKTRQQICHEDRGDLAKHSAQGGRRGASTSETIMLNRTKLRYIGPSDSHYIPTGSKRGPARIMGMAPYINRW